jgi:hypothetical protein
MKALIVYSSQTGNTRKLAEVVRQCWPDETEMASVDAAPKPQGYDCIAVGFWLQAGKPDPKAAVYLQQIGRTPLFLFATHGAAADSAHVRKALDAACALAPQADILGTFNCPGEVAPKVMEKIRAKTPPPPWIEDAPAAAGHPDAQDLANLRRVASGLALP